MTEPNQGINRVIVGKTYIQPDPDVVKDISERLVKIERALVGLAAYGSAAKDQTNGYAGIGSANFVPPIQLGSGASGSSVFLRGDYTWANIGVVPPGGYSAATSVVSETTFGQPSAVGILESYAREDHSHGTPSAQITVMTGWSVTPGYSEDKDIYPEKTSLTEVARVLGTLIDDLKTAGILGS